MAISQGFEALSFGVCEVGGYLLTKALSALWHCYGKKKIYSKSGSKQNKCNKKKESAAHGGKGQEKKDCVLLVFFFPRTWAHL